MVVPDREALITLERRRCVAISAGDVETLETLLRDEYVHVHANALVDDTAGHIAKVAANPRDVTRGDLRIDILGDVACIYGPMCNRMASPAGVVTPMDAYCTQVAVRTDGVWQYVLTHITKVGG